MDKLKPCPFCGGDAQEVSRFDVKCSGCGAEINAQPGQAPELWNRRALTADSGMERAAEIAKKTAEAIVGCDKDTVAQAIRSAILEAQQTASAQVNAEGRATQVPSHLSGKGDGTPSGSKKETTLNVSEPAPSAPDAGQVVVPVETLGNLLALIHQANCAAEILRAAGSRHDG